MSCWVKEKKDEVGEGKDDEEEKRYPENDEEKDTRKRRSHDG